MSMESFSKMHKVYSLVCIGACKEGLPPRCLEASLPVAALPLCWTAVGRPVSCGAC